MARDWAVRIENRQGNQVGRETSDLHQGLRRDLVPVDGARPENRGLDGSDARWDWYL